MINIVIFGAPGSGKGTQSAEIIREYGYKHISTGDLLREEIKEGGKFGVIAKKYIDQGQLVPDDLILGMVHHIFEKEKFAKGLVLDGFPRTVPQAIAFDNLNKEKNLKVNLVIDLVVPRQMLIDRMLSRGKISGRSDDNLETIEQRLEVYQLQTAPIAEYYNKQGVLRSVEATGSIEEITERIFRVINEEIPNAK